MKTSRLLIVGVAVVSLMAGCGGASGAGTATSQEDWLYETMRLNLNWDPGPDNVGPLLANQKGYFQDVKLGVSINTPFAPERPTKYVDEGLSDAAIAQAPQIVRARAEGRSLVAIGTLLPAPTLAMVWLPGSGIEQIADLKGRTIAYPGVPFQREFLRYVLESAGLTLADVKLEDVGYELVPALLSKRFDAIFGGSGAEESALLEARGLHPVVTDAAELGLPDYDELMLIVPPGRYAKEPELFQRLLDASIRGNEAVAGNIDAAARAIVDQSEGDAPAKATEAGLEATAPLLSQDGNIDEARLEHLVDWMHEQGMIERRVPISQLVAAGGQ
jgi:ABC-type nitrate/sulfonate/bicarbonate transport system substrate-binding protein